MSTSSETCDVWSIAVAARNRFPLSGETNIK
jgi:hypothetical protein